MPDVEINGVAYRLAEDAEGEHYSLSAEPLRPPNAVTVQGEDSQKFQMRPDTLLWSLTDWSGGMGQQKFDPEQGNRWRELYGVRVFDPPGKLRPGWKFDSLKAYSDGTVVEEQGAVIQRDGNSFYLLNRYQPTYRKWAFSGGGTWNTANTLTGPAGGASVVAVADGEWIYWNEYGTNNIWKWNGSGTTATQIDSGAMATMVDPGMTELGSYVYVVDAPAGKVWEIPKAGGGDVLIDDFSDVAGNAPYGDSSLVSVGGKIYLLVDKSMYAAVREITPTSAAGSGFGAEIARFPGVRPDSMWAHAGVLYIGGKALSGEGVILYLQPGGSYGSLGTIKASPGSTVSVTLIPGQQNSDVLYHYIVTRESSSLGLTRLVQIDSLTGNMAILAYADPIKTGEMLAGNVTAWKTYGVVWSNNDMVSSFQAPDRRTYHANPLNFAPTSYVVSPWNDFALADEKILSSLVLSMEKLPADWRVRVDYAINGEDTWTNVIDNTTTNSTGGKTWVSTDTSTVGFRTLSIRIRMDYTGAGVPTTGPTILGVDVLAMVAKPTKVWRLLLDLSDSKSRAVGVSGSRQATNLSNAADTESVVAFKDYYGSSTPGTAEEHDVIIDSYAMVLSQPGEGVAAVTLKETS